MPVGSNSDALAAAAAARARARLDGAIDDVFLDDEARLDDATRAAIAERLADLVGSVETDLRRHAARLLAKRGDETAAAAVLTGAAVLPRLRAAGLLRDRDLMAALLAAVRGERIAGRLAPIDGVEPGLLVRLIHGDDALVAAAARALLAADGRPVSAGTDLAAEVQHRLAWWVAAAIRHGEGGAAVDRALADATRRWLAAADEGERPVALAARLAAALDAGATELPTLLVEALSDGRLTLAVALLARALGLDPTVATDHALDPDDGLLLIALRAAGLERRDLARAALSLVEADPRRDDERLADRLDAAAATTPDAARAALAPLTLPDDFRRAIDALAAVGPA